MLFPEFLVILITVADRYPCSFPVKHAECTCFIGICHNIPDHLCLPLRIGRISGQCFFRSHTVSEPVSIRIRRQISGLQHTGLHTVLRVDIFQHIPHILHRAMPVRIIGDTEYIVIHAMRFQLLRFFHRPGRIIHLRVMNGDLYPQLVLRIKLPDRCGGRR